MKATSRPSRLMVTPPAMSKKESSAASPGVRSAKLPAAATAHTGTRFTELQKARCEQNITAKWHRVRAKKRDVIRNGDQTVQVTKVRQIAEGQTITKEGQPGHGTRSGITVKGYRLKAVTIAAREDL